MTRRRTRRWCTVLSAITALAGSSAAPLHAQAVLGFGDDATTAPAGTVRLGFLNSWTRFEQRFTAPDGGYVDTHSRIRRTPISLELGLTRRLALGAMLPSVGTRVVATYVPAGATPGHADSTRFTGQSAVGDAEGWAKFIWLGAQSERERTDPHGVHVRSALTGLVRLGTGIPAHTYQQLAIGTGDGQTDIEAASQWDLILGRFFWVSFVGRYVRQLPTTRVTRVAPRDDPFTPAVLVNTRIEPGDYYEIEVTPRLSLGNHFLLGVRYNHRHDDESRFLPAEQAGGGDPSVLDVASSSATSYAVGVVYSSVAEYAAGRARFPFEVKFEYSTTDRWRDGVPPATLAVPDRSTYALGLRYYVSLWGGRQAQ